MENPYFPYRCSYGYEPKLVARPDDGAPRLVNATLARFPALGFRMCKDSKGGWHYHMLVREMRPNGICVMRETEVFAPAMGEDALDQKESADAIDLKHPPAPWSVTPFADQKSEATRIDGTRFPASVDTFMAPFVSACPAVDSRLFVRAGELSEADFEKIEVYWANTTSSPEAFEAVLAHLESDAKCEGMDPPNTAREFKFSQAHIQKAFHDGREVRISSIGYANRAYGAILVTDKGDEFTVSFVREDGAFRLACVGAVWVP